MNRTQLKKQGLEALTQSRWFYILTIAALAILLLSFLPGGSNVRIFLLPIVGWTSFIWMLRRYGLKGLIKSIVVGFLAILIVMLLFL